MSPICGVILQSHYSLCMSDLHCKHCWSHYLTHIKGCLLKGSENISRDLQPSSLCFRNMLIWSNLSPPLLCCVSCVKLANTLMTHFQNFSNCKDKPLQPSQPQVIKPNPLLMIKFFYAFENHITKAINIYHTVYQTYISGEWGYVGLILEKEKNPGLNRVDNRLPHMHYRAKHQQLTACRPTKPFLLLYMMTLN